jgi:hypothetical protein
MTPKERAIELRFKYWKDADLTPEQAQRCALIAVDEILLIKKEIWDDFHWEYFKYWQEVKQEIENLND